jgi:lysophospholipase L1-like esterase
VTVLLGTNDALGYFELEPTPPEIYRTAIGELAANLLADGAGRVLLLTPTPLFEYPDLEALLQGYREAIFELCGAPGDALLCGPDAWALLGRDDFAAGDVHPNAFGHAKLAAALHDAVLEAVPEPGSALLLASGLAALAARHRGRTSRRR